MTTNLTVSRPGATRAEQRGVVLDRNAIAEAIEFLGIRLPVKVRWSSGRHTVGCHRGSIFGHTITVSGRCASAAEVSRVLWHELKHAAQMEAYESPSAFRHAYDVAGGSSTGSTRGHARYMANAFEVEAREAEEWDLALPLARTDAAAGLKARIRAAKARRAEIRRHIERCEEWGWHVHDSYRRDLAQHEALVRELEAPPRVSRVSVIQPDGTTVQVGTVRLPPLVLS